MSHEETSRIDASTLPLKVREHLMRGQPAAAVKVLAETHKIKKSDAEQIIEDYRQDLRDRKVTLDIKIMQEKQMKEEQAEQQVWWRWGLRITLCVFFLMLIFLVAGL